jgi:hypothetical protein
MLNLHCCAVKLRIKYNHLIYCFLNFALKGSDQDSVERDSIYDLVEVCAQYKGLFIFDMLSVDHLADFIHGLKNGYV